MSSPYLKIGIACALFATVIGLACYSLLPAEPTNEYHYNGLSQAPVPPPPPPAAPTPPPPPPPPPIHRTTDVETIYKVTDQMPLFPGCDSVSDYGEKKSCADRKMIEYVYSNVKYPEEAKGKGVEGIAVISFNVNHKGEILNEKLVRNPGAGTGEEALRVVRKMKTDGIRWTPGSNQGKPVTVQFNLPIKFQLE